MKKFNLEMIMIKLVLIGAINWGLIGFFNFNLVEYINKKLFSDNNTLEKIVYIVVGFISYWFTQKRYTFTIFR